MRRPLAVLLLVAAPAWAQFDFEEARLTKGRVIVSGTEEITEYGTNGDGNRVAVKRTRRTAVTKSDLMMQLVIPDVEAQFKILAEATKKMGKLGHTSSFVYGNNFSRTWNKGEVPYKDPPPPKWPAQASSQSAEWSAPPCDSQAPIIETMQSRSEAVAKEAMITVELVPDLDSMKQLRACVLVGWGIDRTVSGKSERRQLEMDPSASECATKWNSSPPEPTIGVPLIAMDDCLGAVGVDEIRRDGDSTVDTHFPRIPLPAFLAYVKDPAKPKVFTLPFSFKRIDPDQTRTVEGTMTLTFGVITPGKLEVFPENEGLYASWLPVPEGEKDAQPMVLVARLDTSIKDVKEDKLDFSLTDVTAYPGGWGNSPEEGKNLTAPDMVFAPQSKQPDPNVKVLDELHAETTKKVKEARVLLQVRDYAAFGVLRVRAREQAIEGRSRGDGSEGLPVPRDSQLNKIGDAWEEEHKTMQIDPTWDQEEVKGRKAKGDNLSYLEEYRGFKVLAKGKEEHQRLSPVKQEIFVCDPSDATREEAWEKSTDIKMIKVAEKHMLRPKPRDANDSAEWRTVDTRGDKNKPAVYVRYTRSNDPEFDPDNNRNPNWCGYVDEWGGHIAYASPCDGMVHLFEARFRVPFENYREWVEPDPSGKPEAIATNAWEASALANVAKAHNLSLTAIKTLAQRRAPLWISEADIASLTREHSNYIVLHEIGHACGAPGHHRPGKAESTEGDAICPMRYDPMEERIELLLFGAKKPVLPLRGRGRFCSAPSDDCFGDLDAKNK